MDLGSLTVCGDWRTVPRVMGANSVVVMSCLQSSTLYVYASCSSRIRVPVVLALAPRRALRQWMLRHEAQHAAAAGESVEDVCRPRDAIDAGLSDERGA